MPTTFEEKVAKGFEAAGEKIQTVEMTVEELKVAVNQFAKMLRQYGKAAMTGHLDNGEPYKRFWRTDEDAKRFGELILCTLGRKDMGEGTNIGGGVLVPEDLSAQIIQKLGLYGKFRRDALVVPIGSASQWFPKIESDMTVYCPGEGGAITISDMQFSQVKLIPKTFVALAAVSNELDEDSIVGIGEIIGLSATRSMAKKEDEIGFVGDGTDTYFKMSGICQALLDVDAVIGNIAGLVVASGNAYSEITLTDFDNVIAILPEDVDETAKWYMSKKFFHTVCYPLAQAAGVANLFEILSDRKQKSFKGYPVEFVHCMPSTEANSQVCALLGDLMMGAYLGDRKALTLEQSKDVLFTNNQLGIRGVERIDINAFGVGDASEPGPIVGLITAAS
jgi:HK97 family phage major capsid protein